MSKPIVNMENWSVTGDYDEYTPPELRHHYLQGNVYGHPKHKDGNYLHSSFIVNVIGRTVETNNTTYKLGQPDPEFVEWCKAQGCHVPTEEEPIKFRKINNG
jgi:hypothetical protein